MQTRIPRPQTGEYLAYYDRYISQVADETDAVTALTRRIPAWTCLEHEGHEGKLLRVSLLC